MADIWVITHLLKLLLTSWDILVLSYNDALQGRVGGVEPRRTWTTTEHNSYIFFLFFTRI